MQHGKERKDLEIAHGLLHTMRSEKVRSDQNIIRDFLFCVKTVLCLSFELQGSHALPALIRVALDHVTSSRGLSYPYPNSSKVSVASLGLLSALLPGPDCSRIPKIL